MVSTNEITGVVKGVTCENCTSYTFVLTLISLSFANNILAPGNTLYELIVAEPVIKLTLVVAGIVVASSHSTIIVYSVLPSSILLIVVFVGNTPAESCIYCPTANIPFTSSISTVNVVIVFGETCAAIETVLLVYAATSG